jgi:hypothetical protein
MRSRWQIAIVAILLLQHFFAFGDEAITSFMSPIASYQNIQNLGGEVLSSGGIPSSIISYQYSENLNAEILSNGNLISPIVSYNFYDWPGTVVISNQPVNQMVQAGGSTTFSVTVGDGQPPFSYQWWFNNLPVIGATNSSLTIANAQKSNAGNYWVDVSNLYGDTNSSVATLSIFVPGSSGLLVKTYRNGNAINGLADADAVIASGAVIAITNMALADMLGFNSGEGTGHFSVNNPVPGIPNNVATDNYAVQSTGYIIVPASNQYTFGLNTDDGGRLRIDGSNVIVNDVRSPPHDSAYVTIYLTAGTHYVEWTWYNEAGGVNGGGAEGEAYAAPGVETGFSSDFKLLGDPSGLPVIQVSPLASQTSNSVALFGHVTDSNGVPISRATVSAMVVLTPVAQATTDTNGYYQMPPLGAGVYDLWATKAAYQTSIRAFTLGTSTAEQDFQLLPLPATPASVQVIRSPTVPYTVGDLMGSQLLIYNGTSFVPITASNWPNTNLMTIVMTHGWIPLDPVAGTPMFTSYGANSWPTDMANKLQSQGITSATANIVAWDWHNAAMSDFPDPGAPADRTPDQGVGLGEALQFYLGGTYSLPLHFLGHSLGTLVNASAIDYVHGQKPGTNPQATWNNNLIQVTLFDQAQMAETFGTQSQSPLPLIFTWADNYVSLVGVSLSGAVNVELQKGTLVAEGAIESPAGVLADSHGYPVDWYEMSILTPGDPNNPLGFQRSYEYAPSSFPPTAFQVGSIYDQSPLNYDELALEPEPFLESQLLGVNGDSVVQTTVDTVQYTGGVVVNAADSTWNAATGLFNYVWNTAAQGGQTLVNDFNSPNSLGVSLTTGPYTAVQQLNQGLVRPMGSPSPADGGGTASNTPAMVWLPIQFPPHAVAMTFDFALSGDPVNDVLVCGIDTNNLFSISAKYIPTNQFSASRLIDVSAYAGTTNELFFGFLGGTSTNATLQIQNIQFYSLQQPQLNIVPMNGAIMLTWPTTAAGYVIESTPSLTAPVWETATNVPVISGSSYILTNYWSDQTRFFRLRSQ